MLKVVLVEDEVVVRESIRRNIQWEEYGYTFAGEASDGELAYSLIKEVRPDVVITDIKMPFMNGLELTKLVRGEMPWIKVIILTGHSDFEYSQQALRMGASEYLLKPVTGAAVGEAITRIRKQVEEEREQEALLAQYRREMQEMERLRQQHFFENWMVGRFETSQLLETASQLNIPLSAQSYNVILYDLGNPSEQKPYSEENFRVQGKLEKCLEENEHALLFDRGLDGWAVLVKGDDSQDAAAYSRALAEQMRALLHAEIPGEYYVAVGRAVKRLGDVGKSFVSANRAFAGRFLSEYGTVMYAEEMGRPALPRTPDVSLHSLDASKIDKAVTERFLHSGAKADAAALVEEIFDNLGPEHVRSLLLRQYIAMDVHFAVVAFLNKLGVDKCLLPNECGTVDEVAARLDTVESTRQYLTRLLEACIALRDEVSHKRHGALIREAQEFIAQNYASGSISLNAVARSVNISPTHFSAIFSQETGVTFIEWLTRTRMDKAKALLRCTPMKSAEIAYAVGYKDPHYFSYLFKKLYGCTPREFRAGGREEK